MAAIDIGAGTFDGDTYKSKTRTGIDLTNPANDTGTLTSFEIWTVENCTTSKVGTFSGSSGTFTMRDYESIGAITAGSKQTFTGKSCDVQTGDYIGFYGNGNLEGNSTGGSGTYYSNSEADHFDTSSHSYTLYANSKYGLYATGDTGGGGGWSHITKVDGVTASGAAKKDGIAVGSVAKINGVAV